ncbi:hypothetical protein NicSoilB11_20350 [Arthrobacter sp. NicSoilB11]|nr:hypothetical protein NicSoilB11_20350 [Arthrobacter sp. NicSoilB11]
MNWSVGAGASGNFSAAEGPGKTGLSAAFAAGAVATPAIVATNTTPIVRKYVFPFATPVFMLRFTPLGLRFHGELTKAW